MITRKKIDFLILAIMLVIPLWGTAQQFNALLFTKTAAYHHTSIPAGVEGIRALSELHYFTFEWHEESSAVFNDEKLAAYDVVIFLNTSKDILNEEEQAAFERFIQAGKGFVGIHCASSTEYDWAWYNQLIGRMFTIHPKVQTGKLNVIDSQFPGMERMPASWYWTEEWYEFGEEKVEGLNYLLAVDEKTYAPKVKWSEKSGEGMGDFHPIAWYHEFDGGRSFYTGLGHLAASYKDPIFLAHLYGGIWWAATGRGVE